jgi:hypothetical protein
MNIKINDIEVFDELIKSVVRIVPDAQFEVDREGVKLKVINDSQTIRAFFKSDCMIADEPVTFCFKDLLNLKKSVDLISSIEGETECELDFNNTFLVYKNDVKFKLKVVKSDVIENYITADITAELKEIFSFETEPENIKQVIQCTNIVNDTDCRVYFSQSDDKVICEIDDKTNVMANSVGVPISDSITGEIDKPIAMSIDNFQAFSILPCDNIEVTYTDKNVFEIKCNYENSIELYMIATTLKT